MTKDLLVLTENAFTLELSTRMSRNSLKKATNPDEYDVEMAGEEKQVMVNHGLYMSNTNHNRILL